MRMLRVALAAFVLAPLTAAAKPCPIPSWHPVVAKSTTTANDHGFLVMAEPGFGSAKSGSRPLAGDAAIDPAWRVNATVPTIDTLAPGLAVYRIPAASKGWARLTDHEGNVVGEATVGHRAPPPRPAAKSIVRATNVGRRTSTTVTVAMDSVPSGVVALVVATPAGKPLTWGRAGASVIAFANGSCTGSIPGTTAPEAGDKVTLHWVDEAGRLSAASDPLVVKVSP